MNLTRAVVSAVLCEAVATATFTRLVGTSVPWSMLIALPIATVLLLLLMSPAAIEPSWAAPPTPRSPAAESQASVLASRLADAYTDQGRFRTRIQPRLAALALGTLRQRRGLADLPGLADRRARDALGADLHRLLTDSTATLPDPATLRAMLDRLMEDS
jgi:hypothetical protein